MPKVALGMTLYNNSDYLVAALDSLLNQTYSDFKLVAVDNASSDETESIMRKYAERDSRIVYIRNSMNIGLIENFRKAFAKAREFAPDAEYFSWVSDHDIWDPEWLEAHVEALANDPDLVLAYPLVVGISADGEELFRDRRRFDTDGMSKIERVRAASTKMVGAGNMLYGVYRSSELAKSSVLPWCTPPDRLLMLELSVYGTYKQIPRYLWYRRYPQGMPSIYSLAPNFDQLHARQRAMNYPAGTNPPLYAHFYALSHAFGIFYYLSLRPPKGRGYGNAHLGPYMAFMYLRSRRSVVKAEVKGFAKRVLRRLKLYHDPVS